MVVLQVGAYKLANKVKMKYGYLKVLITFLVLNFSIYPYLFDLTAPSKRLPGFELEDSNFIHRTWIMGAIIVLLTHLVCFMNNKAKQRRQRDKKDNIESI